MTRRTLYTLEPTDLIHLGQDRAVEFLRRLLWAEARSVGLSRHLISVPSCINVGDGGIDALITGATNTIQELIPRGTTGFQVKSGDLKPKACKKELHIGNDQKKPLKPEIKRLVDGNGTYCLVLFKALTDATLRKRREAIVEELRRCKYRNARVRVYSADQLIGFAEQFPSMVSWLRGDLNEGLSYVSWANRNDMRSPKDFVLDSARDQAIQSIRQRLLNPSGDCPVFHIVGLPGIGKTRMVFDALSPDVFSSSVIYLSADRLKSSTLLPRLQNDSSLYCIVVVDECDLRSHDEYVRAFAGQGPRLALFTVSNEMKSVPDPAKLIHIKRLESAGISAIIRAEAPALPTNVVDRLTTFSDGFPRIAVLLATSYAKTGASSTEISTTGDQTLYDRLIFGEGQPTSPFARLNKKVLMGLALFSKVGFEAELNRESRWLATVVGVSDDEFREVVVWQKERGVIQGEHYLYVTPFMLKVYLLKQWWETRNFTAESFTEFVNDIPKDFRTDILKRFSEQLRYLGASDAGKKFARDILGPQGIYSDGSLLTTDLGGDFFLSLSDVDPEASLERLRSTVGTWSLQKRLSFVAGRRQIVSALERIAVWEELFQEAARLLLLLAEAENESWANNATGLFAGLFSPGQGEVAPSEASPERRFPVLVEALQSDSTTVRRIAYKAARQALEAHYFTRLGGLEDQGLRVAPKMWTPRTWGEIFDAYRRVWTALQVRIPLVPDDEPQEIVSILLRAARGLMRHANLAPMVLETVRKLARQNQDQRKHVLATVSEILHFDKDELDPSAVHGLEELTAELTGTSYHDMLIRYVGMSLLEDQVDWDGNGKNEVGRIIKELAVQSVKDIDNLKRELPWLVTSEAQKGMRFGYELGLADSNWQLLDLILNAHRENEMTGEAFLLGGYFRAIYERNPERWEQELDRIEKDATLSKLLPEVTFRSGMSDKAARRILNQVKAGVTPIESVRMFTYGSVFKDLSESVFLEWTDHLVDLSNRFALSLVLDFFDFFYIRKEAKYPPPEKRTYDLLTHPVLFQKQPAQTSQGMDEYHWTGIGIRFVDLYPKRAVGLARVILEHYGEDGTVLGGSFSHTDAVLNKIARLFTKEVWRIVSEYLGPPLDSRAFDIRNWLRGGEHYLENQGALQYFDPEDVFQWVDAAIDSRAWYLACFIPPLLFRDPDRICYAREVLVRYGERDDVRSNLAANFSTEGWIGPGSIHYQKKKASLVAFKADETNLNVVRWIDEYVASLEYSTICERIEEERRGF
jgi:hypothetical protein